MRKRALGRTGLAVSELSLGTWGLSGDAYGHVEPDEAEAVLRRAVDMGINLVDTADSYGAGKMELLVGKVLGKRSDVLVVTKGGTDRTTEPARKRFDAEYIKGAVERSLKRLGRERIDVYLLHNPSLDALTVGEAIPCLRDLQRDGKIAHWGASCGDAEIARAALDNGAGVVSIAYNLLHPTDLHRISGDVLVSGAGVLVHSVLGYGILGGAWAKERDFHSDDHRRHRWTRMELERRVEQVDGLKFLVQGEVPSLRGAAVRFALTNHQVSCALLGPKSVTQLEQLVRDTGGGPVYLPDESMRSLPRELSKLGLSL